MKLILSIGILVASLMFAATVPTEKELLQMFVDFTNTCKAQEKASTEDVVAYTKDKVPASKEGKCFVGCMFEKMGLIVNGAFSRAEADKMAQEDFPNNTQKIEAAKKIFKTCEAEIGPSKDKCVTGPALLLCIEKNDGKKAV